jgi:hypothetical protein
MLIAVTALLFALQAPTAWTIDATQNAVRRVHQGPFEGRTMLWVRLAPKAQDPSVSPSALVLVAEFEGKHPRTQPVVTLHAATNVHFYPLLARVPRLRITVDRGVAIDFVAPGESGSVGYCCGEASIPTSVTAQLSAVRLERLASANSVTGDVLGVPFTLDRAQLAAIAAFRRAIVPDSYRPPR